MHSNLKRIFFVTSSIPESKADWKSVFIGDMLNAFAKIEQKVIYWGPEGVVPKLAINSVTKRYQTVLGKMMLKGGIAKILRKGSFIEKLFYPVMLLSGIRSSAKKYENEYDIYFINWLQNALSIPSDGKEIVISVLGSDMGLLDSKVIKYLLKRIFKKHKTILLPNAGWMIDELKSHFGNIVDIQLLPLGIREDWFINIERTPTLWLSVSRITDKKVRNLFNWGEQIFSQDNKLSLIGPNQENLKIPFWSDYYGSTTLKKLMYEWYPKSKALIFLSEHNEGRPQTIIEAMASGVPVICMDKPLYREFIETGVNGYLVNNSKELALAIKKLELPVHNLEISRNAKTAIKENIGNWEDYVYKVNELISN